MCALRAHDCRWLGPLSVVLPALAGACSVSERELGVPEGSGTGGSAGVGTAQGGSSASVPNAGASGGGAGGSAGASPELGQGGGGLGGTSEMDAAAPPSGLLSKVWTVGSLGNGPGFFGPTARSVGVDRDGYIYVGEYDVSEFEGPERVQVFDANGDFVRQWNFQGDGTFINAMTVDQNGILSSVQDSRIFRYDGRTGALIGEFTYNDDDPATPPLMLFPDVLTVTPENELVAISSDAIVRFNELGVLELANVEELEELLEGPALPNGVAVDGLGNIYVVDRFEFSIFKFSSSAVFQDRISSEGPGPGKLASGPGSIAVDGRGRIYAMEYEEGIEVFDAAGDSLGVIPIDGYAYSMAVSLNNELIVIDAESYTLTKYAINP
jgi:sugar lactone lactonase YvrE